MILRLGLPSKGRLRDQTVEWFAARGIEILRDGSGREYRASLRGVEERLAPLPLDSHPGGRTAPEVVLRRPEGRRVAIARLVADRPAQRRVLRSVR